MPDPGPVLASGFVEIKYPSALNRGLDFRVLGFLVITIVLDIELLMHAE
jgi:hypothetical protein